jgi:ankyrin repeat protein
MSTTKEERLHRAILAHNVEDALALIAANADVSFVDSHGTNAVILTAETGNMTIMREIMHHRFKVNHTDRESQTALMRAAFHGHYDATSALIKRGADVNLIAQSGQTALMKAAFGPQEHISEICQALLEAKALPDVQRPNGDSALHIAAERGSLSAVKTLVQFGANPDLLKAGQTAMMAAAQRCSYLMVQTLVRIGADPEIKNADGKSVSDLPPIELDQVLRDLPSERRGLLHLQRLQKVITKGLRQRQADADGVHLEDSDEEREKMEISERRKSQAARLDAIEKHQASVRRASMERQMLGA